MKKTREDLEKLIIYCMENQRVCPKPQRWNEIYELLPNKKRKGLGWKPPIPLILAAWWETSDKEKIERFQLHLKWAAQNHALEVIAGKVKQLDETDWHHKDE